MLYVVGTCIKGCLITFLCKLAELSRNGNYLSKVSNHIHAATSGLQEGRKISISQKAIWVSFSLLSQPRWSGVVC